MRLASLARELRFSPVMGGIHGEIAYDGPIHEIRERLCRLEAALHGRREMDVDAALEAEDAKFNAAEVLVRSLRIIAVALSQEEFPCLHGRARIEFVGQPKGSATSLRQASPSIFKRAGSVRSKPSLVRPSRWAIHTEVPDSSVWRM